MSINQKPVVMDAIVIERKVVENILREINLLLHKIEVLENKISNKREIYLDAQDVCVLINISKRRLQYLRIQGYIPYTMIGSKVFYRGVDIKHILESNSKIKKP